MGDGRLLIFNDASNTYTTFTAYEPKDTRATVVKNSNDTYSLHLKDGGVHNYNSSGKLSSIVDRNGNTTTFSYNSNSQLVTITATTGRTLTFTYNSLGLVSAVSDGINFSVDSSYHPERLGNVAYYDYDVSTQALTTVTYSNGSQYKFTYAFVNNQIIGSLVLYLTVVKDAYDNVLETHQYDSYDRATTSEISGGVEHYTLEYLSDTQTRVTDALNRVTVYTIDKSKGRNVVTQVNGPGSCSQTQATQYWYYDSLLSKLAFRI